MRRDVFARVAAEAARHGTVLWLHFLGEPLLHPQLVELIEDARRAGVASVGLSTNATLLRGIVAERLLDAGLHRLDISIDADDAVEYASMRGADHFDAVIENVEAFLALRRDRAAQAPRVGLQFMATPAFEAKRSTVIERWDRLLDTEDFIKTIDPAPFLGAIRDSRAPETAADRPPCPWLSASLMVLQDGTVTMCGADWDARAPIGHVDEASIEEIWNGPVIGQRRAAHLAGRFEDVPLCGGCQDWRLADGHGYRNVRPGQAQVPGPVTVLLSEAADRRSGSANGSDSTGGTP